MPEVTITSVEKISDTLACIVAELSQDIDQGFVSFQKNRNDTWTNMVTDNGEKDFALAPKKTVSVGETYTLDNSIGMYVSRLVCLYRLIYKRFSFRSCSFPRR